MKPGKHGIIVVTYLRIIVHDQVKFLQANSAMS